MKTNFICFKFSKVIFFTSCILIISIILFGIQTKNLCKEKNDIQALPNSENICDKIENTTTEKDISDNSTNQDKVQTGKSEKKSRTMPSKLKNFRIIGKIEIPKLKLEKYILDETSVKALKVSVTKLYGPEINTVGNFCIAGHNYNKVFGGIKNLKRNDKIILTDIYGNNVIYQVYDSYQISPKDISCLNQDTGGDKEITLITCTKGAIKRVVVKAVEVYDFKR